MIGILVTSHGGLADAMVKTLRGVVGAVARVEAISTTSADDPEALRVEIRRAIDRVDDGDGVLILTDMLGDTATNVSLVVAGDARAEVVAGVNMPMLVKAVGCRSQMDVRALAGFIREYGREHIFWASERTRRRGGERV